MKIKWKELVAAILIPLAVGGLSAFITGDSMAAFEAVKQPPLSPPGWLFPVVWTVLYILMGISSYLIYISDAPRADKVLSLGLYGFQLFFNFFWSIIFFSLEKYLFAFVWLFALWLLILMTILAFRGISKTAAWLLVPYLLWVTFAGYLNLGIYLLN
ncbi:MAG: tryptophan-rich sensory protein [Clostridia bacterium]|nr:tryptophan-rich sensory protein [Clostridia bacterium]